MNLRIGNKTMTQKIPEMIAEVFSNYTDETRRELEALRTIIFEVAEENSEIGPVTETLKWGQPAYLTEQTKSGTTIRLGAGKEGHRACIYVHCQSKVADQIRDIYPNHFIISGNREITPRTSVQDSHDELKHCIALALTYHLRKKS